MRLVPTTKPTVPLVKSGKPLVSGGYTWQTFVTNDDEARIYEHGTKPGAPDKWLTEADDEEESEAELRRMARFESKGE